MAAPIMVIPPLSPWLTTTQLFTVFSHLLYLPSAHSLPTLSRVPALCTLPMCRFPALHLLPALSALSCISVIPLVPFAFSSMLHLHAALATQVQSIPN
ncbi:hypothetical protein BJY52DRAFT_483202 [Lactarius psammicola]|nr:hypothetical protein BJY52DRAFT_483202 [Lactarius psammicola]